MPPFSYHNGNITYRNCVEYDTSSQYYSLDHNLLYGMMPLCLDSNAIG